MLLKNHYWCALRPKPKPTLQVSTHGVPKRVSKLRRYKCPAGCKVVTKSQWELNQHVHSKHPAFRFKCKLCGAEYLTYNARFKHEETHKAPAFICPYKRCNKSFHYERDYKQHKQVHTGKNKYPFPTRGSNKSYTTMAALKFHMKLHEDLQFICDTCGKIFHRRLTTATHAGCIFVGVEGIMWGSIQMALKNAQT